jgi:hypothetical protein
MDWSKSAEITTLSGLWLFLTLDAVKTLKVYVSLRSCFILSPDHCSFSLSVKAFKI